MAAPASPAPAAIVFGAAIAAAREQDRRAAQGLTTLDPGTTGTGVTDIGTIGTGMTAIAADRLAATMPAPPAATLDTADARWPQAMIARIETLRDAVDAADTRIRLLPDALGTIDVVVRRDGDAVHVHFTAEQPQTRALLQDAQPRLAEAAEQRGVRLGQTSVDGGTGQNAAGGSAQGNAAGGQGQPRQSAPEPRRPAATTATSRASADPADDARIA